MFPSSGNFAAIHTYQDALEYRKESRCRTTLSKIWFKSVFNRDHH